MGYFGELYYPETKRIFVGEPVADIKATAKALETKYNTAKQGADALDIMASTLDVRDIDYSIKKARIEAIRNGFKDFAEKGNWEDATYSLQKEYKDFATDEGLTNAKNMKTKISTDSAALLAKQADLGYSMDDMNVFIKANENSYTGQQFVDPLTGEKLDPVKDKDKGKWTYKYSPYTPSKVPDFTEKVNKVLTDWKANTTAYANSVIDYTTLQVKDKEGNVEEIGTQELRNYVKEYFATDQSIQNWFNDKKFLTTNAPNRTYSELVSTLLPQLDTTSTIKPMYDTNKDGETYVSGIKEIIGYDTDATTKKQTPIYKETSFVSTDENGKVTLNKDNLFSGYKNIFTELQTNMSSNKYSYRKETANISTKDYGKGLAEFTAEKEKIPVFGMTVNTKTWGSQFTSPEEIIAYNKTLTDNKSSLSTNIRSNDALAKTQQELLVAILNNPKSTLDITAFGNGIGDDGKSHLKEIYDYLKEIKQIKDSKLAIEEIDKKAREKAGLSKTYIPDVKILEKAKLAGNTAMQDKSRLLAGKDKDEANSILKSTYSEAYNNYLYKHDDIYKKYGEVLKEMSEESTAENGYYTFSANTETQYNAVTDKIKDIILTQITGDPSTTIRMSDGSTFTAKMEKDYYETLSSKDKPLDIYWGFGEDGNIEIAFRTKTMKSGTSESKQEPLALIEAPDGVLQYLVKTKGTTESTIAHMETIKKASRSDRLGTDIEYYNDDVHKVTIRGILPNEAKYKPIGTQYIITMDDIEFTAKSDAEANKLLDSADEEILNGIN